MKRFALVAAVLAGAGGLLLAAAFVAVRVFLPPEKLKELAVAGAAKSLHRQLEVRSVDLSLVRGLRIQGLRLSERPDFSKGEFLKAGAFTLRPEWMPLLHKKIVARGIALEDASATVVRGKDGLFNFSDLVGAPGTAAPSGGAAPAASAAPMALVVDSLRLAGVSLRYVDRLQGAEADLKVDELKVDGFKMSGPFSLSAAVHAGYKAGKQRFAGSLKAKGTADLAGGDLARLALDLSKVVLAAQGKEAAGSLKVEGGLAPRVSLELDLPALDSKFLNAALAAGLPAGMELPPVKVRAALSYAAPSVDVSSFKISAAGAEVSGKVHIPDVNAKTPRVKLEASSNEFKLGPLLAVLPSSRGTGMDGKASFRLSAEGPAGTPDLPVFEGALSLDPVSAASLKKLSPSALDGVRLPGLSLNVSASMSRGTLDLKRLQVRAADLDAKVSGSVAGLQAKTQTFRLKVGTNDFKLSSLAEGAEGMARFGLSGTAGLDAEVSGTGASPKASGRLSLKEVGLRYGGQTLENVTGAVQFTQDSMNMPQLTGRVNGGDFRLKVSASNPAAPVVTLSGSLSLLDLGVLQKLGDASAPGPGGSQAPAPQGGGKAASGGSPPVRTSGDITVDKTTHPNFQCGRMTLSWNLSEVTPDLKRLGGTARLSVGPGRFANLLDAASSRGGMTKALVAPLKAVQALRGLRLLNLDLPDMNNVAFDSIEGVYSASQGVISVQPFQLQGPPLIGIRTTGRVDMAGNNVDLRIVVRSSGIPAEMGKELNLTATGPVASPSVKLDAAKQVQGAVQELIQNKAQGLLKGLLQRH